MKDERLIILLDAYLDGSLLAEEKKELERMLLESDAARREFWDRASLHGWTHAAAKLNYGTRSAADAARERRELRGAPWEIALGWLGKFGWKIGLAGAMCTAVGMMLWMAIRSLPSPDEDTLVDTAPEQMANTNFVATLTRGTQVVWDDADSAEIGAAVPARWLHLKSGAVQIEFYDGARVILEGPAALELVSAGEARLDFGKLSARVPEPAHGFKVYTPDATVTDLGTAFGLERQKMEPVKLEVFEGKIEVATENTNQPQVLNAGEAVTVSAKELQPMAVADRVDFLGAEELARRESAELSERFQGWKQAEHSLDYDPATLVHLNFEDQRNVDRNLVNRASVTKAGSSAMIFGCDWGEGRWPGKSALEFNSLDDRVKLLVPGHFESLTYLAWLRVDSLPNPWNALALVDTFQTGETHWQIHRDGSLELAVRLEGGQSGWDRLVSSPIVTREHFGRWIQLTAVCDGKAGTMSLYFNGELVAAKVVTKRSLLTLGTMELGNWTPNAQKTRTEYRIRDFHGRMDEFALLSRPLSAGEIRRQYELGKPRETTVLAAFAPSAPAK